MTIKPFAGLVLVKRLEADSKTPGGILLPDQAKGKSQKCRVVAVGAPKQLEDGTVRFAQVSAGQTVYVRQYAGTEIKHAGKDDLVVISEDDLLASFEE